MKIKKVERLDLIVFCVVLCVQCSLAGVGAPRKLVKN